MEPKQTEKTEGDQKLLRNKNYETFTTILPKDTNLQKNYIEKQKNEALT